MFALLGTGIYVRMRTSGGESVPLLLAHPRGRVAVFRALQLGDMLCAVPALRALRAAVPSAEITLVGLPWAAELVRRYNHLLDAFIPFPGYPGLPEQPPDPPAFERFLARMHAERFDLVVQMHGNGTITNPLVARFGARRTAGFHPPTQPAPDPASFMLYPENRPEPRRHLLLVEFLGAEPQGEALEFPLRPEDERALESLPEAAELTSAGYACLHPGGRNPARRWPAARFAELGDELVRRGLRVVITGSRSETAVAREVAARMRAPAFDLAGRTTLGTVGVLLSGARVLVSNDTGPSHLADALSVPSVVLYLGSDVDRWAPADATLHRRVRGPGADVDPWGVSAADVLREVDAVLQMRPIGRDQAVRRRRGL